MVPGGGFESPLRHHYNSNRSIKPTLKGYWNPKFIVKRRISYYGFNYGQGYTSAMGAIRDTVYELSLRFGINNLST
tara:strand:+ start:19 stop:246 length:228 start_codon:yes stop_codon:yes gene_type:complete